MSFLLLLGMGCQQDPRGWYYTSKRPQEKDLVGVYNLDSKNYQNEWYTRKGLKLPQSTLTLNIDGTWTGSSVPDCWTTRECSGKVENIRGRWAVGVDHNDPNWWVLHIAVWREGEPEYLHPPTLPDLNLALADPSIFLMNNKPPYILHFMVGDPDSGDGLSYTK